MNLLKEIDLGEHPQTCAVREEEIEALIKQEGFTGLCNVPETDGVYFHMAETD